MHEGHHGILDGVKKDSKAKPQVPKQAHTQAGEHDHNHEHDHDHDHDHDHTQARSGKSPKAGDPSAQTKIVASVIVALLIVVFFVWKYMA